MKQLLCCLALFLFSFSENSFAQAPSEFLNLDAPTLDSLINTAFVNGNYKGAITYLEALLKKVETESGTQDSAYGYVISDLGFCNMYAGDYVAAEKFLLQGQRIFTKIYGTEHTEVANALSGLAKVYKSTGRYEKAEEVLLEVKRINAKLVGTEHPTYAVTLNDLAVLYYYTGRYEEAEVLYLKTKEINAKVYGIVHQGYSNALANLAALYFTNQQYEEAELLYLEAVDITIKVYGKKHPRYANNLSNLAALYFKTERYKEGEKICLEAQKIRAATLGVNHPHYANNLNLLASSYQAQGRYEEAVALFLETGVLLKKTLGVNHPKYARYLASFAITYFKMGRYKDALRLRLESLEIVERRLGAQHEDYAECLNVLGNTYLHLNNIPKARFYLTKGLQAASDLEVSIAITEAWKDSLTKANYLSINHIGQTLYSLEYLYSLLEKEPAETSKSKQLILTSLAQELFKKIRKLHTNSNSKLRTLERSDRWTTKGLHLLSEVDEVAEAFDLAEASKSVLLLEATKAEKAYQLGGLPDSLMLQESALFKERDQLEANSIQKRPRVEQDSLRTLLNAVHQKIRSFVGQLEQDYPRYVQLKYKNDNATVVEIQNLLAPKTALLEYVVTDSILYLFYIDKKNYKMLSQSIKREQLSTKIKELYKALSNYDLLATDQDKAYEAYTRPAYWFYQQLIAPILTDAVDIKQLIVVPDGELAYLPFETFLMKPAKQGGGDYSNLDYLVKHYKVSYNYSATLWKENIESTKSVNNGQMLAMAGDYDLQLDTLKKELRLPNYFRNRKGLKPLYAAEREVRVLSKAFQGYFGFNEAASERLFKEKAADYAVIHLAMHGILDYKQPILSSLVFTEDGDSLENSFLQAYEISNLKLNADLVVLSACETGFGTFEKGNGIASLARSFMYAGASSMVVTLWQVNDYATAEIMKELYSNLSNGMTKSEALQQAKLNFIENVAGVGQHPAFWSPFVLIGNDEPIEISRKSSVVFWGMVLAGVLALVFGAWFWRKR